MKRLLFMLLAASLFAGCGESNPSDSVVSDRHIITYTLSSDLILINQRTLRLSNNYAPKGEVVELAWEGTVMNMFTKDDQERFTFLYAPKYGQNITLEVKDHGLYANGSLVSYSLQSTNLQEFTRWANSATASDLANLTSVNINLEEPEAAYPALLKLVETNPKISINAEKHPELVRNLTKIATPSMLDLDASKQEDRDLLRNLDLSELVSLNLKLGDEPSLKIAEYLSPTRVPKLRHLALNGTFKWEDLGSLTQLKSLSLYEAEAVSLAGIDYLHGLQSLVILGIDHLESTISLTHLSSLQHLHIDGLGNTSNLEGIEGLTFLGLEGASQPKIDRLLVQNPDLKLLDIAVGNEVISLRKLTNLSQLVAVAIPMGTGLQQITLTPLGEIATLKHVAYNLEQEEEEPDAAYEARVKAMEAEIRQQCPECTINAYQGFCLGSGWLLLLLPAFVLLYLIQRRRQAA